MSRREVEEVAEYIHTALEKISPGSIYTICGGESLPSLVLVPFWRLIVLLLLRGQATDAANRPPPTSISSSLTRLATPIA